MCSTLPLPLFFSQQTTFLNRRIKNTCRIILESVPLLFFGVCKKIEIRGVEVIDISILAYPSPPGFGFSRIVNLLLFFFFFFFLVKILGWVPSSKPMLPACIGKLHDQFKVQFQSNCIFYEEIHPVTLSRTYR